MGSFRAGAITLSLWLASALAAQAACTWDVAFTFVGQTKTINTNDCELAGPDGTYGSFYDSPTVDIQFDYGLGANDAGLSIPEQRGGSNGGNYEFTFNVSNSVLQIKLLTAPPSGSDSFSGYMYTGNAGFLSNTPATINFTYPSTPTLTAVTPSSGPTGGGTTVIITGTGFAAANPTGAVKFGATNATYTINGNTQITATAPANSAGTYDITVTTPGGMSATHANDQYTYVAAPTVTSVSPTAGSTGGGTTVTITGTGFSAANPTGAVKFGATNASYTINSNTQITATAPANSAGTYDITVTTPGGTSATSASDQFTYVTAPTVTSTSPAAGPTGGGTSVAITGTGFTGATAVTFGATPAASYTIINSTQITATAPAGTGTVDIRVTTTGGTSATSASDQFTYVLPPTVTAVSPTAGPTGGGMTVTITGTGFAAANPTGAVKFGATNATYTINSDTQITATAPANSAGTYDITVTTVGGTSATHVNDRYTYVAAPTVTSVSPISGPTGGGTTVTITGTGFSAANPTGAVKFGAATAIYTINSSTQITATAPANSAGTYDITVTTPGGTSATNASDQFTYVAAPTVTSTSPAAGPTSGGTTVTITGTGFAAANPTGAVKFGATTATYTINSNTQITATAPASAAGTYDITVATPGGTSATSASDQYTYVAPPVASSFTYGSIVPYNDGSNTSVSISLTSNVNNSPTSYAVGSATTAQGGSVSVDSSGQATYTPPVGYRNANDSFTFTATNLGGTSSPATVTVTIGNPTITVSLPSTTATVERAYNAGGAAVTFSGGRPPYTVNSISGLPAGLTDSGGGVIGGTPTANGTFTVTVNVTDSSLGAGPYNANTTATLTVVLPPAPVVSSFAINGLAYNAGSATATTFSASPHATESPTGYQVGASSYGATVSVDSAGLMSYTPPVGFRGTDTFNYVATNAGGTSNVGQVFATVNDPVFLVTLPATTGTVGDAYNSGGIAVSVNGGKAPYSNFSATGLPAGLSINSSGVISGTPTAAGNATVTITATDSSGGNGSFTSTGAASISIGAPTITINPATLPNAENGVSYGATLSTTGGIAPFTFGLTAGSLPDGLALAADGTISGTPTGGGTYHFTVTASDSAGTGPYTGARAYALTVDTPTIVLSPSAGALPGATTGLAYSQSFGASGGTGPYTYSVTGTLPTGLSLSSAGVLSGTPTAGGTFTFTVSATDSATGTGPFTAAQNYSLTIAAPTIAVAPSALPNAAFGAAYSQTVTASGGIAPYSYSVTSGTLPQGLNLSAAGVLSGTPTEVGTFNITISATDAATGTGPFSGAQSYALVVDQVLPIANAVTATVAANSTANGITLAITGGAADSVAIANPAAHGTATASGTNITYTPAGGYSGTDSFTYTATNVAGTSSAATVTIAVTAPTLVLSPGTGALADGTRGTVYSRTVAVSHGTAPYAYAVTSGALPAGLALDATGVIGGTPTATGSFSFTVTATDAYGATGSASYSLAVRAMATFAFTPQSGTLSDAMAGEDYRQQITAAGGAAPLLYRIGSGALPDGMVLNVSTGELTGPLDAASHGNYTFSVVVEDNNGATGSATYSMTVKPRGTTVTDQVVNVPAGTSPPDIYLNRGATGGPFTGADVAFVEPPNAGTATIIQGRLAQAGPVTGPIGWYLQFTPNPAFSGAARVGFRLTSSLGSSNIGTVTYNLAYAAADVAEEIDALVSGFVETRQSLIANGIYVPGLLERRQMQQATDSVTARMTPSEEGMTASFSTSLAQLDAARDSADGIEATALPPFNMWIDGTFLAHKRDQNDGKWGNFAMLNLGADYLLSERALVGLSFHFDRMTDPSDADAELTGNGWLAGPYASFEIGKGVFWDTSLLYGGSTNDIDTVFWNGDFDTTRWMIDTAITGEWQLDDATVLTPKLRAVYFNEKVDDYSVRNDAGDEITIDGFDAEQFRVSLGAEIARSFTLENGSALTPKVGVTAGYSGQDGSGLFAAITAGLSLQTADLWMLSADLLFDIEGDGEKAVGGKVRAGKQF
ncbi:IPT/TIG domain-containing protein (plasmid) [Ensifer adhaerens]|uniref:IPT/TIG domain-containing protein n=1 Tax=Ensifer adhaerens TaxID=106592 RepID=UPI001C4E2D89|nr:IPT/TIG domain-containing protein [Ensifer adhaerens]MBW0370301.1 IPT/TIG domain-containing protein [Ensifer adhaerens]UCM24133.1 IPT/TIG domain-containing protein [Ensifer adhaerens]